MRSTDPARDERRAEVRRLGAKGLSTRAIAARLDVSKDTVRRDLEALSREAAAERHGEPDCGSGSPQECAAISVALTGALDQLASHERRLRALTDRLGHNDLAHRDAPPGAPPQHDTVTVALDNVTRGHLDVLAEAGHTAHDAVRLAVEQLADAYRTAWDYEVCPRGTVPRTRITVCPPHDDQGSR
ncbi:DeoR family transcriptional regulator [Streptomyces sp. NPDC088182]|uniref:DeoR family transcriptional regulator n=1 Tax=Streptomyces sp. NPDC088182 TaxID=3365838 RepID=UPI00381C1ACE